jgi:hypothetical protein
MTAKRGSAPFSKSADPPLKVNRNRGIEITNGVNNNIFIREAGKRFKIDRGDKMIRTRVTDLLGSDYPFIFGGLYLFGGGKLVASASEAGGFGLITAGAFNNKKELMEEIESIRGLTGRNFGIAITLGSNGAGDFLDAAVEARVKAVLTSGQSPPAFLAEIKKTGTAWLHASPTVRQALQAEEVGADAVLLTEVDDRKAAGREDKGFMSLLLEAADALSIPLIANGSIINGKTFLAALALGAEGVLIGSRAIRAAEPRILLTDLVEKLVNESVGVQKRLAQDFMGALADSFPIPDGFPFMIYRTDE